ncbi:MAG: winged helix-turn-helix transcriptional regulator [Candidatus Diapherotrites archaeon]|nr:winged helix-turn-helix transcriptional regulator [Candidatus Micrarchaeota archaeon]MBU1939632.1 winged helix-turn-helix transcriptional regulator [Candidatus Micrarchaeota archaeon]
MDDAEEALALDVRQKIYTTVQKSPALHFREIQRRTSLGVGALQYHLEYLQKAQLIRSEKDGKFVRYFAVRGKQVGEQSRELSLLRQESIRRIVIYLLTHKRANNVAISKAVNLSPPTTSWHLGKLISAGIVEKRRRGRKSFFYLTDKEKTAELIVGHKKSFVDEVVDNFVEVWKEIEV